MSARLGDVLVQMANDLSAIRALLEKPQCGDMLIGPEELAAALGVSARTLRKMRAAGEAPKAIEIAGKPRWKRASVEAWIARRRLVQ